MKIKDLKKILETLPEEMVVISIDQKGSYKKAVTYIDGTGDEDEFPMEWLVIAAEGELESVG